MEQVQKEKMIGVVVLVFGFVALFAWFKYTVLVPPLPSSAPQSNRQALGTIPPTAVPNPAEKIPSSNPFDSGSNTNPFSTPYANPFK